MSELKPESGDTTDPRCLRRSCVRRPRDLGSARTLRLTRCLAGAFTGRPAECPIGMTGLGGVMGND